MRSDHHGHNWQGPADAPPREEVGARDREGDEPVAQHGEEVPANAGGAATEVPSPPGATKLASFIETIKIALLADARHPRKERRTAKALLEQITAAGYEGGCTQLTDFIRTWRATKVTWRLARRSCR